MSLSFRYISSLYLKYFFYLFISLECFFVIIDLIKFLDDLPSSANLFILLLVYDFMYASQFILPLALILAQIILTVTLLKNAQFTAFLALGFARIKIFYPIFLLSFCITLSYIALNATPFAYAKERVDLIIDQGFVGSYKSDLFVKYNQSYIYFKKIYPLLQSAEDIIVYEFDDRQNILTRVIESKKAQFNGQDWVLKDATITTLDNNLEFGKNPLEIQKRETYEILRDFKPKILENIYEKQGSISILDAFEALVLLNSQNVNTQKIRGILYSLIIFPFFAPLIMICLAIFIPNSNRYINLNLMVSEMILGVLITWGIFFSFSKLSMSGFLQPEFSIMVPMFILLLASSFCFYKIIKT